MIHYALIGTLALIVAYACTMAEAHGELVDQQETGRSLSLPAQAKAGMFMRKALGMIVYLFGVFFPFVKRPKSPQRFIVKNDELYEYDSESRRYHPWKSSVPKR